MGEPRRNNSGEVPARFSHCLVVCLALLAVFVPGSAFAVATATDGPRLAIMAHNSCCGSAVITVGPNGEGPDSVIEGPRSRDILAVYDRPSWSADGGLLAFGASRFGDDGNVVAIVREDGGGLRLFPRAVLTGGDPVISPDGATVAFQQVRLVKVLPGRENVLTKSSIWLLDVEDGSIRQLTRWRVGTSLEPTSYSPDGATLAAQSYGRRGFRAVAIDLRSGRLTLLVRDAVEPTYSPDGTRLAFVRLKDWLTTRPNDETAQPVIELFVADAHGDAPKRLLRKRGLIAWPSWDPSSSRLAFTRSPVDSPRSRTPLLGNKVMAMNADGTCLTKLFSDPELTLSGSAWQPGIGRDAGPISC
jgi:Tol biopolymer transport system component